MIFAQIWESLYNATDSTQQRPWKPTRSTGSWEIPLLLWNLQVHITMFRGLPLILNLNQMNPVHDSQTVSVIFTSILIIQMYLLLPVSSKQSLFFRCSNPNPLHISALCMSHTKVSPCKFSNWIVQNDASCKIICEVSCCHSNSDATASKLKLCSFV